MKKHLTARLVSMLLVVAMLVGFAVPVSSASAAPVDRTKLDIEKIDADGFTLEGLDTTDELEIDTIPEHDDKDIVRVSIVLDRSSTIEAGFSTLDIAQNTEAMAYRQSLQTEQAQVTAAIEQVLGTRLDVAWNLTLAANIISANVQYGKLDLISEIPGVQEVVLETRYEPAVYSTEKVSHPNTATAGTMIGTSAAYANGYTGAGSRIAVIDTGIDTDHQSFSPAGYNYALAYQAGLAKMDVEDYVAKLDLLDAEEIASVQEQLNIPATDAASLYINNKIPYAFNYVDGDLDITHDNDSQGEHGSHVEGIAAANAFIPNADGSFSRALDTVLAQGVAPDAQIIVMKVFGKSGGAYDSDYMAAIEDAIVLGCDSVNLSLGTAAHGFGYNTTYQEILDSLTTCDTVVTCSGGNNGHWADNAVSGVPYLYNTDVSMYSGGAPGAYTNTLAVASVDNDGVTGNYFTAGEDIIFFNDGQSAKNVSLLTLAGTSYEYILLDSVGTAEEFAAIADVLPGKIAVCSRGTTSFFEKANAAVSNGAAGVIIANNTAGVIYLNLTGYNYTAPVVSITQEAGQQMKASATAVTDEEGNVLYYKGTMTVSSSLAAQSYYSEYYTISSFSSWGVPGSLELKPEITAPGGNIYSVDGSVEGGTAYEIMSGTSMAAPQVAGMAALVAQHIRENGLDEKTGLTTRQLAQSLLMSTAEPMFEQESGGNYYAVIRQGAGLGNVGNAVSAQSYIMMGEDATESWIDGKVKAELGDDPQRKGEYSFSFTLNNMTDSANTYTLAADFFTQGLFAYADYIWLDTWTTALPADVTFLVGGETFVPVSTAVCDLDEDGDTDAEDAQIIVEYCSGTRETIAEIADVDGNGEVTTYDAYLILDSMETRNITLPAGGKVDITVKATLPQSVKDFMNTYYPNGTYVQGYVYVLPTATEEGVFTDVTHSIPVVGFYGNWTDASMFEPISYTDYVYQDYKMPYTGYVSNNLIIKYPGDKNTYWQIGNPYFIEANGYPAERVAISSGSTISSYPVGMMRNADALLWVITGEDGEIISMSGVSNRVYGSYYYANYGSWQNTTQNITINKKVSALGLAEGDKFTVSVVAIPEYYQTNGALTAEQVRKLIADGTLGKGAFISTTMTVDDTAPEIVDIYKDMKTGNLIVTAQDNNYVSAVQVVSLSGSKTYGYGLPAQTEAGQPCGVEIDLSGASVGEECVVLVADYANNTSAYRIVYGGEGEDFTGRMFGFTYTNIASTGSGSRWMEIDPDHLYVSYNGYEGLTQVGTMDNAIHLTAAEYVDGYVFMAADNGKIYAAPQDELSAYNEVGDFTASTGTIWDMAFNYADNKMYAVGDNSIVYTMNLLTGELTQAFTMSLYNPANSSSATFKKLQGLAIDSEGNFWGINSGKSSYATFLYKWTASDIVDGAVTGLKPVVDNRSNDADAYGYGNLAWDFTTGTLYWCCAHSNSYSSSNNALYRFNLETGKAVKASSYSGSSSSTYASRLGDYYGAFYIVPGSTDAVPPSTNATALFLDITEMTMLEGAWFTTSATVYPWNLADKSIVWTSSNENVAIVDNGKVTAVGVGTATITATTVASPNLQATCEVTVNALPEIKLSGLVYDAESTTHWSEFTTEAPDQWTALSGDSEYIIGGSLLGDVIYGHDGSTMYAVDPDTFETKAMGGISTTWMWSDSAPAPATADGKSFGLTTALCYNGTYLELVDVPAGYLNYFDLSSIFSGDPMAAIAYVGSSIYTVPATSTMSEANWPSVSYYILTEGGNLWYLSLYSYKNNTNFEIYEQKYIGHVDLSLEGVSAVTGGTYASMFYDQTTGYLLLSRYAEGDIANLYAIDLSNMLVADLGNFGENVWPVVSLYQYDRVADLTVRVNPTVVDIYEGDTVSIAAKVRPATFTGGVVWSSSDDAVATVDQNGVITGVGEGTTTITATSIDVNEQGETVSASVSVSVSGAADIDVTFHGQVTTADGTSHWATIKTSDLSTYTVNGTSSIVLKGGGAHEGKIWGHNVEPYFVNNMNWWNFFTIDPDTYECVEKGWTLGVEDIDDLTTAPAYQRKVNDVEGNEFYVEAMGNPIFVSNGRYVEYLKKDYIENYYNDIYLLTLKGYGYLGAITFIGITNYNNNPAEEFYILCDNGDLIRLIVEMRVNPRDPANNYLLRYWSHSYIGNIGVDFARSDDLSMVLVNDGTNYGLLIAESGNGKGELFWVDLNTEGFAAQKVGNVEGVTYLTSLYTDYELNYDTGDGDAATDSVSGVGTAVSSSAALPISENYTGEALAEEPVAETTANRVGGATNTLTGEPIIKERPQVSVSGGKVTTGDNTVAVTLTESENVTNGVMQITYDPKVLTYASTNTAIGNADVKVDAENGTVTFAYASVKAMTAESILATVNFTYTAQYIETKVTVATLQRNTTSRVDEESTSMDIVYEVGGHSYKVTESKEVTCTEDGYKVFLCTKCGDTYREDYTAPGHFYEAFVTAPTCTEEGYTTYICTGCGESYVSDKVPTIDHTYEAVVTEPTCTEMGYTTYTCSCGDSYKDNYVAPTGHRFGEWVTVTEPDCMNKGKEMRTCECGETEYRDIAVSGHTYETKIIEPTCTKAGYTEHICTVCGDSYMTDVTDPVGHQYEAVITEPTCTEEGYTTYTCVCCGESYVDDIVPATGHTYGDWVVTKEATCTEGGIETRTCACGATETRETAPFCPSAKFQDVKLSDWFHDAVDHVVAGGIMEGTGETTFSPNGTTTRAQLVTVLYRLAGAPETELTRQFSDVKDNAWYAEAVAWAYANGITSGITDTLFAPEQSVTREQVVTFLYRYAKLMGMDVENDGDLSAFTDAGSISAYAVDAFTWAVDAGIINGMTEDTLAPRGTCIRAQIATILMRFMELGQ